MNVFLLDLSKSEKLFKIPKVNGPMPECSGMGLFMFVSIVL